jgi:predicted oxidoreductase (fatty acid repression mutant protein)
LLQILIIEFIKIKMMEELVMSKDFLTAVADRRSFYGISKEAIVSEDRIKEIVEHAVKYTPSAFNSQSVRVVLLLGTQHDRLWDITMEALRKIVPAEQFGDTENRINSFKNGYGTVLFFDDSSIVESLQQQFALYKDNFPVWSQQSNGMHQYVIWTALELEGFGASLQHYAELIDADVKKEWNIPGNWKFIAQMPFGKPTAQPDEKQFQPLEERIKVYN